MGEQTGDQVKDFRGEGIVGFVECKTFLVTFVMVVFCESVVLSLQVGFGLQMLLPFFILRGEGSFLVEQDTT